MFIVRCKQCGEKIKIDKKRIVGIFFLCFLIIINLIAYILDSFRVGFMDLFIACLALPLVINSIKNKNICLKCINDKK
jgi:hypothetical protein